MVQGSSRSHSLIAHFAFPVVTGAAIGLAIFLMDRGMNPLLAALSAQVPAFLTVIVLERLFPFHPSWNRNHADLGVDIRHIVTVTLTTGLADPALRLLGVLVGSWLLGGYALQAWPSDWPLLAQLGLALVIGEFGQYWAHRLGHEIPLLWRFHALHHSAPRLYWLNAARFHPVDILLGNFAAIIPLVALGAGERVLILWVLFAAVHGIFQHCNLPVRLGPLNWVFSMAELHRWHHSRRVVESNRNYGQNLIVWDTVFGTRFLPSDREPPRDIGLTGLPGYPMGWLDQELAPFRWSRVVGEATEAGNEADSPGG